MRIIQIISHLNRYDAIGNEALAMDEAVGQMGIEKRLMAFTVHEDLRARATDMDLSAVSDDDIVLFHISSGGVLIKPVSQLSCKKVLIYHNITPAKFFLPYDPFTAASLFLGRRQLRKYAPRMDACWADSNYNAKELLRSGVKEETVSVLPILFSEGENQVVPDPETAKKLKSNKATKFICIGRVAPNKKLEDAVKVFVRYLERYDPDAVLYLIGSWEGMEKYYAKLRGFLADLKLGEDRVVFTGRISEAEKAAYLRNTDALLCMSEHEGFCVPLPEAMRSGLPVLAYAATAVPETLGDSELLFKQKDYGAMADALERLRTDDTFRTGILESQRENLKRFDREATRKQFMELISGLASVSRDP